VKKGIFITLEGPDGSGKTTQAMHLAEYFKKHGREVVVTREPGGTPIAEKLRDMALDPNVPVCKTTESLLHLAARADHVDKVIQPALDAGKVVICDRFSDSTLVYQGVIGGMPLTELRHLNDFATQGLRPDLTLLLDGTPEEFLPRRDARGVSDKFEQEGLAFQRKIREGYLLLAREEPERIVLIHAAAPEEEVTREMVKKVEKFI
jgi:dTMP kinase